MTGDPIARLKAGLDADEAWASAASEVNTGEHWHWVGNDDDIPVIPSLADANLESLGIDQDVSLRSVEEHPSSSLPGGGFLDRPLPHFAIFSIDEIPPGVAGHIARQDPARTLRRVAVHREILDKYEAAEAYCKETQYSEGAWAAIIARDAWKQATLALAAAYSDEDGPQ